MSGDEAGALERLKRFLNKSPRIIREKKSARWNQSATQPLFVLPAPTARSRAKLGTLLRLDLTDEKYLARALSLSQSLAVSAKKR